MICFVNDYTHLLVRKLYILISSKKLLTVFVWEYITFPIFLLN